MIPLNTPALVHAIGTGVAREFPINFPSFENYLIEAEIVDVATEEIIPLVENVDYVLTGVSRLAVGKLTLKDNGIYPPGWVPLSPAPVPNRQDWLTEGAAINDGRLADGYRLHIRFSDNAHQPTKPQGRTTPEALEIMVDRLTMHVLALKEKVGRSVKFNPLSIEQMESMTGEEIVEALEDLQTQINNSGGGGAGAYEGFSARFGEMFSSTDLDDTLKKILILQFAGPTIALGVSPSASLRERGAVVPSVTMTATTGRQSEDIASVSFYRNGVLLAILPEDPTGGTEAYVSNAPFSNDMTFQARVKDTTGAETISNMVTYSFVYPYYHGKGAAGLNAAGIVANLTKDIRASSSSVAVTASPTNEHFYFCYPSAYPALTSIMDPNGFENISGYTVRTVTITGLDGTPQSYRVYELTTPTTQVNFTNTFIR